MGQNQLLLIILGMIIIGVMITVAIILMQGKCRYGKP